MTVKVEVADSHIGARGARELVFRPHLLTNAVSWILLKSHGSPARPNLGILSILLRAGFITSAERRIWAELKYRDDRPVLNGMELVSKPSKPIFMEIGEIRRLCSGRRAQNIKPLGMGEGGTCVEARWRSGLSGTIAFGVRSVDLLLAYAALIF
ncbi:37S ribosomal protein S8, mitochondrial [Grifola frondosa]|uniref:37S ribosomal protein S8, mitochondrial n=1 Tax=Grifola frondosa TaxID=5627 RepID=A0A1C7MM61_GRIFR|nr:37S ribosomal protein S8, mitochondrial [Grifola frondosa]